MMNPSGSLVDVTRCFAFRFKLIDFASDNFNIIVEIFDNRIFDLEKASESKTYCDEVLGILQSYNLKLTELSTHLQGLSLIHI